MTNSYVVLDLETTGLSPCEDKIIEIAAIKCINGEIVDRLETLINPERKILSHITGITGISNDMVSDAPVISEVINEVIDFLGDFTLVGHNISFDFRFIAKVAGDFGMRYNAGGIDTLKLAKKHIKDIGSRSLESLCEYFGIETIHHRAMADVMSTYEIFNRFLKMPEFIWKPEMMTYSVTKTAPATDKQIRFLGDLIKRYGISYHKEIRNLTRSEASREIDKILSVYGINR